MSSPNRVIMKYPARFFIFFLLFLFSCFSAELTYSQTLSTKKGAFLYPYSESRVKDNKIISLATPKKVGKGKKLEAVDFLRLDEVFHYDAYLVSYKGNPYIISSEYVEDNSSIINKNNELDSIKAIMEANLKEKKQKMEDSRRAYPGRKNQRLSELESRLDSVSILADDIEKRARAYADSMVKRDALEYEKELKNVPQRIKNLTNIITIKTNKLHYPNSAGGCDYEFAYINNSKKTIKYLIWYGSVYNAVDDRVPCTIMDTYTFSGKDTGPYEPGFIYCGGTWDCIIYNWSAKTMSLSSITIYFMDGSSFSTSLKKGDWDKIQEYYKLLARRTEKEKQQWNKYYETVRLDNRHYSIINERDRLTRQIPEIKAEHADAELGHLIKDYSEYLVKYDSFTTTRVIPAEY